MKVGLKVLGILGSVGLVMTAVTVRGASERAGSERMMFRWQGPFHYEQHFATTADACSIAGLEVLDGTMICTGPDVTHMQCTASGRAARQYSVQAGGVQRTDHGSYEGPLAVDYSYRHAHERDFFNLSVVADVPMQYREQTADGTRDGKYVLQVGSTTESNIFSPAGQRIEWRQSWPVREPGPAPCPAPAFNGTSSVQVRLLPTD